MRGLHVLEVDGEIVEVVQVDAHGGYKALKESPQYTTAVHRWRWDILKEIEKCLS